MGCTQKLWCTGRHKRLCSVFPTGEAREIAALVSTMSPFQNLAQKRHFCSRKPLTVIYVATDDTFECFIHRHLRLSFLLIWYNREHSCVLFMWMCYHEVQSPTPECPAEYTCMTKSKGERAQCCCLLLPVRESGNFCTNCL